jgi:hypothetical protein
MSGNGNGKMNKHLYKIFIPFLAIPLLLGCNEKEAKISEPSRLGCDSACDDEKIKD